MLHRTLDKLRTTRNKIRFLRKTVLSLRGGAGSTGNLIQRKPESKNKRTLQNRARNAKKVLLEAISRINGGRNPEDLKDEEVADTLRHLLTRTRVGKNFCADFDKALLSAGSYEELVKLGREGLLEEMKEGYTVASACAKSHVSQAKYQSFMQHILRGYRQTIAHKRKLNHIITATEDATDKLIPLYKSSFAFGPFNEKHECSYHKPKEFVPTLLPKYFYMVCKERWQFAKSFKLPSGLESYELPPETGSAGGGQRGPPDSPGAGPSGTAPSNGCGCAGHPTVSVRTCRLMLCLRVASPARAPPPTRAPPHPTGLAQTNGSAPGGGLSPRTIWVRSSYAGAAGARQRWGQGSIDGSAARRRWLLCDFMLHGHRRRREHGLHCAH